MHHSQYRTRGISVGSIGGGGWHRRDAAVALGRTDSSGGSASSVSGVDVAHFGGTGGRFFCGAVARIG